MKLLQQTATITMKTKEDSEVLEISSVSENGPGTGTVKIDVVDSSKPKTWHLYKQTTFMCFWFIKISVLSKIQKSNKKHLK